MSSAMGATCAKCLFASSAYKVTEVQFKPFSIRWWLEDRSTGRLVVAQKPNLILGLCLVGFVANFFFTDVTAVFIVGKFLWLTFAADELFRGVNPMRRIMGVLVAVFVVVS